MNPAYGRIVLRYVAGYLAIKAFLPQDIADLLAQDEELAGLVGAGIALAVEGAYTLAKKFRWRT